MNPQETQLEELLGRVRFQPRADRDEQILREAEEALGHETAQAPNAAALKCHRRQWHFSATGPGMRIIRRAAIVLLPLVFVFGIVAYLRQPSLTLAQVAAEFQKQSWVHVTYDNGREEWTNLVDGRFFLKDYDGRAVYTEASGLRLAYWPGSTYISKDKWFVGDKVPTRTPTTAWNEYVTSYAVPTGTKESGTEEHDDNLDGKKVVRFDSHFVDALGRKILVKQIWADPSTRLPIKVRDVLQLAEREDQKRDAIVGTFSFPTAGPSDIYELGVSKSYAILDTDAKPTGEIAEIYAAAKKAREKFPKHWRIVRWRLDGDSGEADLEYRDGVNHAFSRWFTNTVEGYAKFPFGTKEPQAVLDWMKTRNAINQTISTAEKSYSRRNPSPGLSNNIPKPTARVMSHSDWGDDINFPPGMQWAYCDWTPPAKKIDPPPGTPAGLIVLRREVGEKRTDYWIDPARDYVCVKQNEMRPVNGEWKPERIDTLEDWVKLPAGSWFAVTKKFYSYGVFPRLRENDNSPEIWHSDFRLSEPGKVPADAFDGEKLLKDATLESY
jgi:hypothetical protein